MTSDDFPIINTTRAPIPSGGLVRITGIDNVTGCAQVDYPNLDSQANLAVVGPTMILPLDPSQPGSGQGMASFLPRCRLTYDPSSGVPANGDTMGSRKGSFLPVKGNAGFYCLGGTDDTFTNAFRMDAAAQLVQEIDQYGATSLVACVGCGWVSALRVSDCVKADLLSATGACSCGGTIPESSTMLETVDALTWTNATSAPFLICGIPYQLAFTKQACNGPCLTLATGTSSTAPTYTFTRDCCGPNYADFSLYNSSICGGTYDANAGPVGNLIRVRISWAVCGNTSGQFSPTSGVPGTIPASPSALTVNIPVSGMTVGEVVYPVVLLTVDSTQPGTIRATLTNPAGTQITLFQAPPGGAATAVGTGYQVALADNAAAPIQYVTGSAGAPISGAFTALQPLATLAGNPNGTWVVSLQNVIPGGVTSTLKAVALCFGDNCTPIFVNCAPAIPMPAIVTATYSNLTGGCSTVPAFITGTRALNYDGNFGNVGEGDWLYEGPDNPLGQTESIHFGCGWNGSAFVWSASYYPNSNTNTGAYVGTLVSISLDPFQIIFDFNMNTTGFPCTPVGTVRITFTE